MSILRPNRRPLAWLGLVTSIALLLTGCGALRDDSGRPLNTLSPKGQQAQKIDDLVRPVFWVAGIIFVLVQGLIIFMVIRFRRRKDAVDGDDEPVQVHGNTRLELFWTAAPAVLLVVLAVFNVQTIFALEKRPPDPMRIEVIGQQWWWEFRYDIDRNGTTDIITSSQMVIPTGEVVDLDIKSNDVIHSFWIPNLHGKRDAVPGHNNNWSMQADNPGVYQGQCTEFCGLSHGYMRMEVKALSPDDFKVWADNQRRGPVEPAEGTLAAEGKKVMVQRCLGCHQVNGLNNKGEATGSTVPDPDYLGQAHPLTAANAPNLTHLMSRNRFAGNMFPLYGEGSVLDGVEPQGTPNEAKLEQWLQNPGDMKPMAPDQNRGMPNLGLSAEEIRKLIAYLTSLK